MFICKNQLVAQYEKKERLLLRFIIVCLRYHRVIKKVLLQTLENKSDVVALGGIWMTLHDNVVIFNLKDYQPKENRATKGAIRRSGGVVVFIRDGIYYDP